MYWLPARQRFKMKHNQMLHLRDEHGVSYCQLENVSRGKALEWLAFEDTGGRSVCKNCMTIQENSTLDEQYAAVMAE